MDSFIIGVTSSATVSFIFLWFLYNLRPKIAISPYIAKHNNGNGKTEYGFKFINKSKYPIIEIYTMVRVREHLNVPDGKIFDSTKLLEGSISYVAKYDKNDDNHHYAQRFYKVYDLESKWNDNISELEFIVIAKHGLSGFSAATIQTWYKKSASIRTGQHKLGLNLDVE